MVCSQSTLLLQQIAVLGKYKHKPPQQVLL